MLTYYQLERNLSLNDRHLRDKSVAVFMRELCEHRVYSCKYTRRISGGNYAASEVSVAVSATNKVNCIVATANNDN